MYAKIVQVELNNETLDWSLFLEIKGETLEIPLEVNPLGVVRFIKPYNVHHEKTSTFYTPIK